jgi:hypothetical protein
MKVQVYADTFNSLNESTLVWEGDMACIPREGDTIFIFEGWGGARVTRVYWELPENSVELHIDDRNEEYKQHVGGEKAE